VFVENFERASYFGLALSFAAAAAASAARVLKSVRLAAPGVAV